MPVDPLATARSFGNAPGSHRTDAAPRRRIPGPPSELAIAVACTSLGAAHPARKGVRLYGEFRFALEPGDCRGSSLQLELETSYAAETIADGGPKALLGCSNATISFEHLHNGAQERSGGQLIT